MNQNVNNPKEQIDILDEFGQKTGEVMDRLDAHLQAKWHESVHIYLVNNENKVLLQKRSSKKSIYPNVWAPSVGGHIVSGDNMIETAIREAKEEIGVIFNDEDFVYLGKNNASFNEKQYKDREFVNTLLANRHEDVDITYRNDEIDDLRWFTNQEIIELAIKNDPILLPSYHIWLLVGTYVEFSEPKHW